MEYIRGVIIRLLLAFSAIISLEYWYTLFNPLTLYLSYGISSLFYTVNLGGNVLFVNEFVLVFVNACSAGSAYMLLALLILFTDGIKLRERGRMFLLGSLLILLMNLVRIEVLIFVLVNFGKNYFDYVHMFFWHVVSTIFVFLVWIYLIKKFKVKKIPIYSDYKKILKYMKKK